MYRWRLRLGKLAKVLESSWIPLLILVSDPVNPNYLLTKNFQKISSTRQESCQTIAKLWDTLVG